MGLRHCSPFSEKAVRRTLLGVVVSILVKREEGRWKVADANIIGKRGDTGMMMGLDGLSLNGL